MPSAAAAGETAPRFGSGVDAWLVALVAAASALCLWQARAAGGGAAYGAAALTAAVVLAFMLPCDYTLQADHLAIRCGFLRWRVPYVEIDRIERSRSLLSGPALSLRRVKIGRRGRAFVLVSPKAREAFIAQLAQRTGAAVAD